jgi:hypothetical protein
MIPSAPPEGEGGDMVAVCNTSSLVSKTEYKVTEVAGSKILIFFSLAVKMYR